ncbi:hypothetical protein G7K_1649-t1 [Saitoella complicata NRRL Y-17804]|uniref:Uncharacterized protein n=1 Tax=Saitoella complicata (strain BCRC 22490 / CBS 7301 / JCM 7358 / NBRC 10748 / NRRL Y-17804) TaxID=698492 RepID=A0A0E9NCM0_SAICN|nr:hypothetical protein G7K_1649-t1 [Saitoella complicata NRRL Y-17804]
MSLMCYYQMIGFCTTTRSYRSIRSICNAQLQFHDIVSHDENTQSDTSSHTEIVLAVEAPTIVDRLIMYSHQERHPGRDIVTVDAADERAAMAVAANSGIPRHGEDPNHFFVARLLAACTPFRSCDTNSMMNRDQYQMSGAAGTSRCCSWNSHGWVF